MNSNYFDGEVEGLEENRYKGSNVYKGRRWEEVGYDYGIIKGWIWWGVVWRWVGMKK